MEPFVPPEVQVQLAEESQRIGPQKVKEAAIPSNIVIEEKLQALKLGIPRQELSQKGQEVAENFDALLEDTWRLFVEKNKDEDLQKTALHASRAAQIARRNDLLSSPYGRLTLEQATEAKYNERVCRLVEELSYIRDTLKENETAEILQHDIQHLARSIVYDSQGQPTISSDLVNDLEVLFGTLLRKVQFIPVPHIAVVTNDFDFACDDIVLNMREVTPKQIQLESLTNIHNLESEQSESSAIRGVSAAAEGAPEPVGLETFERIYLREIHADLPGISWYFNKKGGMIHDHDRGKADIKIYGKGMSVDLDVQPGLPIATEDRPVAHTLEVKQCKATIHRMSLRLYDARHDWLYTVFHSYIKGQVRRAIESSVGRYLKAYVTNIDRNATIAAVGHYPATRHIMVSSQQEQKEHQEHYRGHEKEQLGATIPLRSARTVRSTSVGEDDVPQIHRLVEEDGFKRQGGRLSPFEEGPA